MWWMEGLSGRPMVAPIKHICHPEPKTLMGATAERTEESCGEAAFKCKIEEIRNYKVNFADAKKILHMSRVLDVQDDTLSVRAVDRMFIG